MIHGDDIFMGKPANEITNSLPARVSHKIKQWIKKTPDALALNEHSRSWTFAQLGQAIDAARLHLEQHQVRPGDRVMIIGENSCALIAFIMAASEMDAWIAIINARLSKHEIEGIKLDCEPRHIIYTTECSSEAKSHAQGQNATFQQHPLLGEIAYSGTLESTPEPVSESGKDQVFAMIYTSGTTGQPKGVMLTHQNIAFVATISGELRDLSQSDRVYTVLPISHVFGLASTCLGTLFVGGCLYLAPRFDTSLCIKALLEQRITVLQGVPPMFCALVDYLKNTKGMSANDLHLRYISCGGAPLDPETKKLTEEFFKIPLNNGYGMTETSPTITQTRIDEPLESCATGRPIPGVEIRLMAKDGTDVAKGEVGELWIRGPNVMKGYFRKPEQTAEIINSDGWLNTKDLAQADELDNVYIIGRTKEMIVKSGFNVYPAEVEAALNTHPLVVQSAVIGRQVQGDEAVLAFVQPSAEGDLTVEMLKQHCRQLLSPYKCPSQITIMSELPATATGKILKSKLKNQAVA